MGTKDTVEPKPSPPTNHGEIVDRWFTNTFLNRGIETQEWNRLVAAKANLIAALTQKE